MAFNLGASLARPGPREVVQRALMRWAHIRRPKSRTCPSPSTRLSGEASYRIAIGSCSANDACGASASNRTSKNKVDDPKDAPSGRAYERPAFRIINERRSPTSATSTRSNSNRISGSNSDTSAMNVGGIGHPAASSASTKLGGAPAAQVFRSAQIRADSQGWWPLLGRQDEQVAPFGAGRQL